MTWNVWNVIYHYTRHVDDYIPKIGDHRTLKYMGLSLTVVDVDLYYEKVTVYCTYYYDTLRGILDHDRKRR